MYIARITVAQMAEQLLRILLDPKVRSSNPSSGSYETVISKLKPYCLLQHATINNHNIYHVIFHSVSCIINLYQIDP